MTAIKFNILSYTIWITITSLPVVDEILHFIRDILATLHIFYLRRIFLLIFVYFFYFFIILAWFNAYVWLYAITPSNKLIILLKSVLKIDVIYSNEIGP